MLLRRALQAAVGAARPVSSSAASAAQVLNDTDRLFPQAALREFSYAAPTWSQSISTPTERTLSTQTQQRPPEYSFASPESDFTSASLPKPEERQPNHHDLWIESLTLSSPETATGQVPLTQFLNAPEILQLRRNAMPAMPLDPLPTTLQDAMKDPRAVVVTHMEPPFAIVDVNDAWVGLCGYSKQESRHASLARLLQGPATDSARLQQAVQQLVENPFQETSTTVTNYDKSGRPFTNHVRMGALYDNQVHVTHFVGILTEVTSENKMSATA